MKKAFLFLTMLLGSFLAMNAAEGDGNKVSISSEVNADKTSCTVAVSLDNVDQIVALQLDIDIPEGMAVGVTYSGTVPAGVTLTNRCGDHIGATGVVTGNKYRVVVYSMKNTAITGNNGVIFTVNFTSASTIADPSQALCNVSNVILCDINAIDKATVSTAEGYLVGDINMDGNVDVFDIVAMLKIIKGENNGFNLNAANVNGDQSIDVFDVVALLRILKK